MTRKDSIPDEGDGLAELSLWRAPRVGPHVEAALRREFGRRQRASRLQLWVGRAAVLALALGSAVLVRLGGPHPQAGLGDRSSSIALITTEDAVRVDLDLAGFRPVAAARIRRVAYSVTEAGMAGLVPVKVARIVRMEGGQ